ncbi:selenoneine biosynthesis selenosugar synthase SenB [Methyloversatilis sp. XJ19-49]|uniref:selenoneine biosynthesis selenosugar synthase SenB n=1 Tax=Methyloversatilis sp. XJ19-49 TaxID=2963429 RepID=UPI00211D1031|nr:selenoneine biosynthesis selenosugar synthase SenB [Methyloversatilis sp. XJ19-49]MCQ9378594.1 TIGR04348 family glycosyltransferase [Methyloversatilis sp. XJ19-49]
MSRLKMVIVTPALADANNGNWRTARRWASMLRDRCEVHLTGAWNDGDESVMIALHARRSAASAAAWRARHPERPLIVVLTGTDLYRDIATDASARHSLDIADRLVVLNALGPRSLPDSLKPRCRVVLQSCPSRIRQAPPTRYLRALMIGHLRAEKAPDVLFDAVRELAARCDIRIDHIGSALDPELGEAAGHLMVQYPAYRWLGGLSHDATRRRLQRASVLVHPSRMEGGAHTVIEAIRSGVPVLASRIDGNVGLLGADYDGYCAPGDAHALAALLARARDDADWLAHLAYQCDTKAALFSAQHERSALHALIDECLASFDAPPTAMPSR